MKDLFSNQSKQYAVFRPQYPETLYNYLFGIVKNFDCAWDCATGNGQAAAALAAKFKEVYATDISEQQLANAVKKENIYYKKAQAEDQLFEPAFFDLITVAQAVHWFRFDDFYTEVKRVLKPDGIIAVIGYGLIRINDSINKIIDEFYKQKVGAYWDKERRFIDEEYKTIPFPFIEMPAPSLSIQYTWGIEHLIGYINTWSSVQHYFRQHESSPIDKDFLNILHKAWPQGAALQVEFPLFIRIGRH